MRASRLSAKRCASRFRNEPGIRSFAETFWRSHLDVCRGRTGLLSAALFFLGQYSAPTAKPEALGAGKSIAVLPFEHRSEDKANAYFADGIQDEILTRLAKVDDLKVISRTSTQHYKSSPANLPRIV